MAAGVAAAGYRDYRRSDPGVLRMLRAGPSPIGEIGRRFGISRQAARKLVDGLARRGLVTETRDPRDARRRLVALTPAGEEYARVLLRVLGRLNRELAARVPPTELAAVDAVLRAAITDPTIRAAADRIPGPPA
jgi:DNA-binding MarR family transcriptional regulator